MTPSLTNWKQQFRKLWTTPNDFTPTLNEPIYNLDKRRAEIESFISSLLQNARQEEREKIRKVIAANKNRVDNCIMTPEREAQNVVLNRLLKYLSPAEENKPIR